MFGEKKGETEWTRVRHFFSRVTNSRLDCELNLAHFFIAYLLFNYYAASKEKKIGQILYLICDSESW